MTDHAHTPYVRCRRLLLRVQDQIGRRISEERGQAAVEFGIVLSVLLLIVVGILYFGRFLNYTLDETHLANIAARYAAVNADPACPNSSPGCNTSLAQYVKSQGDPGEFQSGSKDVPVPLKVCISPAPGTTPGQGAPVQATVSATYHFIPFLNLTIPVTETATIRAEQDPDPSLFSCSS